MAKNERVFFAYEIHGHQDDNPMDYKSYFSSLSRLPARSRKLRIERDGELVAIPQITRLADDVYALRFVSGNEGDVALFYNVETGEERAELPDNDEVSVASSWVVIDASNRIALRERKANLTRVDLMTALIEDVANSQLNVEDLSFAFHPLTGPGFLEEFQQIAQVKEVRLSLSEPNSTWKRRARNLMQSASADSDAGRVELSFFARRKRGLSKDTGVVPETVEMVEEAFSPLKSASIAGLTQDGSELTASTRDHPVRIAVEPQEGRRVSDQTFIDRGLEKLRRLIENRQADPSA